MKASLGGFGAAFCLGLALLTGSGCDPEDRSPGLWLSGAIAPYPEDWSFTDAIREIYVEVATPYFVRHSVTIWCTALDGRLYVGASDPERFWVARVDADPDVRLEIEGRLYAVRLVALDDPELIMAVRRANAVKYRRDPPTGPSAARYWLVTERMP